MAHATPMIQQALLQFVKVVHALLENTPYLAVDQTEVGAV